jgi:CDP-diacylglycerol--serine O-phosphatidyltransferase
MSEGTSEQRGEGDRGEGASLRLHGGVVGGAIDGAIDESDAPPAKSIPGEPPLPRRKKKFRPPEHRSREHRRRRLRRHGRRAYVRSVYFLPSLATLGNAICGFGSMYVASLNTRDVSRIPDVITQYFAGHSFLAAAYLIFFAMIFDALDGRLARYTRHTTDFGGQLDSLADVVSFGCAPAFLALQLFKSEHPDDLLPAFSRLIWAIGALYMSCAAMRLARFNVSNEHGEQAHFSFLGLPSPGAGGAIAGWVLLQQELRYDPWRGHLQSTAGFLASACVWLLPVLVLGLGLLMISHVRYGHMVNRYLRGKRSIGRLLFVVALLLLILTAHRYVVAIGAVGYAFAGVFGNLYTRFRRMQQAPGK